MNKISNYIHYKVWDEITFPLEWGGWETRVVVAREEFWAWALSSLCVTHQRQSGGTTSSNT